MNSKFEQNSSFIMSLSLMVDKFESKLPNANAQENFNQNIKRSRHEAAKSQLQIFRASRNSKQN